MIIKLLQVVPSLNSGGVERGVLEIAEFMQKSGHRSFVTSSGGKLVEELEKGGSSHIKLPLNTKNPINLLINIFRIYYLIRKHEINIVHARSRAPAWSAYFASKLAGVNFVTTFHGTYGIKPSIKKLYNCIMLKGKVVIAISEFIKDHILNNYQVDTSRIKVINRCVDTIGFNPENVSAERVEAVKSLLSLPQTGGRKIILLPARFTSWKGQSYLLDILSFLDRNDYLCLMVGEVEPKRRAFFESLKSKINDLNLTDKIHLCPEPIRDMPALYTISDIVISPSTSPEAFGRTIVEAASMKKIVIATPIGGAPLSFIEDGITGFHMPLNSPYDAAKVIDKALNLTSDERENIISTASKKVHDGYTLKNMCSKTLEVYSSIL